jgi:hypothetical protein
MSSTSSLFQNRRRPGISRRGVGARGVAAYAPVRPALLLLAICLTASR